MRSYTREDALRLYDELRRSTDNASDVTSWLMQAALAARIDPLDLRIVRANPAWAFLITDRWVIDWGATDSRSTLRTWRGSDDPLYEEAVRERFIDP